MYNLMKESSIIEIGITSVPFDTENTGDYDYLKMFQKIFNLINNKPNNKITNNLTNKINNKSDNKIYKSDNKIYNKPDNIIYKYKLKEIKGDDQTLKKIYIDTFTVTVHNKSLFKKAFDKIRSNKNRQLEVLNIINKLKSNNIKTLIIEYRAPETGCLFFPEDIINLKNNGIKVIIVCHELYINVTRPYLKK